METPQTGTLLIADPFLQDPNFMRNVVCLCEHNNEGSFGFNLSKKLPITIGSLIAEIEDCNFPVYEGGPVQKEIVHVLHCYPSLIPESIPVCNDVYWGGNFAAVIEGIKNKLIEKDKIKFFLGYSGWAQGQLEDEMSEKSWLTVHGNNQLTMFTQATDIWGESLKQLGGKYIQLIHYPSDPQFN
jgi:putative transcriptional regulator